VQGILGGVTVLYRLPLAVSVAHACLAQVFFCLTVALATVTAPSWARSRARFETDGEALLPQLAALTTGLVFALVFLGALMRHMGAGLAIPDFPLAFGRFVPPLVTPYITVHFAHRVGALVVAIAVTWTVARALRHHADVPTLRRPALLAAGLLVLQITLGALTIWSRRAVLPTTTHLVVGAALLATCLTLTLRAARALAVVRTDPAPAALPGRALA
jgi:cytochrome c oxidase assembly protein subunit 15